MGAIACNGAEQTTAQTDKAATAARIFPNTEHLARHASQSLVLLLRNAAVVVFLRRQQRNYYMPPLVVHYWRSTSIWQRYNPDTPRVADPLDKMRRVLPDLTNQPLKVMAIQT